jgi:Zn-dependent protease with chaperone function
LVPASQGGAIAAAPVTAAMAQPQRAAPPPIASPAPLTGAALRAAVMGGFRGGIAPVAPTGLYQLGILLTASFMVLLPLVYLGIIGLVGLGVFCHLAFNHVMMSGVRGRGALVVLALYLAPAIVGGIMTVFMIKPFFARASSDGRTRSLTPQSDPLLFEFVYHICALVGASRPKRIDVNCDINAAAAFRNGWLSLLGGDMVLLIGMPLAAGLTLRQFAGVLAHEFGHFSQGFGMRLTYVIRSVNFWFMRVVYERDAWDDWLRDTAGSLDLRIGWIFYLAMAGVWLSRRILWVLMYAGHMVAGFMLRQMEFDADRYEARLAGSETFASTERQLKLLNVAWRGAQGDLASFYHEGRLADNLPRLLMSNMQQLPKEVYQAVDQMVAESTTGLFDTHPADKDRIAAAYAEQAPGIFFSDLPASALFSQFDATARNVTEDYYREIFGPEFKPSTMHGTEALITRNQGEQTVAEARQRFFAGAYCPLLPLRLPSFYEGANRPANHWKDELLAARAEMERLAPAARRLVEAFDQADTRLLHAEQAKAVLSCGVRLQIEELRNQFASDTQAAQGRREAQLHLNRYANQLEPFADAAGQRLRAALFLLAHPAIAARVPQAAEMLREGRKLAPIAQQIANLHGSLLELRTTDAVLNVLLVHFSNNNRHETLIREILTQRDRVYGQLSNFKAQFNAVDYPFDHAEGAISVGTFLIKYVPPSDEIGELLSAAGNLGEKLVELNARIVSRLCVITESVEGAFGLAPLVQETFPPSG